MRKPRRWFHPWHVGTLAGKAAPNGWPWAAPLSRAAAGDGLVEHLPAELHERRGFAASGAADAPPLSDARDLERLLAGREALGLDARLADVRELGELQREVLRRVARSREPGVQRTDRLGRGPYVRIMTRRSVTSA